ncbi:MAG: hypothetical protein JW983_00230 [Elusimicrobia bacterium]|nr:hypothetical protein [Elusimicrobiota bacterium]
MGMTSFDEKIIGLKSALDASKVLLEKQLRAKEEEIENLKRELEIKSISSPDMDSHISKLKENMARVREENQELELAIADVKRKLALAEQEVKTLDNKLAKEQLRMGEIIKTKENNFIDELKKELQYRIEEWDDDGYSSEDVKKERQKWLHQLQCMGEKLEDTMDVLGCRQKKVSKTSNLLIRVVIAGAVISALIAAGMMFRRYSGKDIAYSAPYSNPSAVAWDGQNLWTSDWFSMKLIRHDMDGSLSVARIFQLKITPFGLAWDGENMWTCDSWTKKINRHANDSTLSVIASYDSPGPNPVGLCWDGRNLWSLDSNTRKIYKHKMDSSLSVIASYNTPGHSPSGIFYDGKNLWSSDSGLNRIYKHNMDDTLSVKNVYIPKSYRDGKARLLGIATDGKHIWSAAGGVNKIYKHKISSMIKLK